MLIKHLKYTWTHSVSLETRIFVTFQKKTHNSSKQIIMQYNYTEI